MGSVPLVVVPSKVVSAKNVDEIKLLIISDPHMASSSPPSWKADYKTVVEATVEQVLLFGVKQAVDVVVWPGDLFHRKSPDRNPLWFVEDVLRLMKKTDLLNVGIAGNHDLKWGSLKGLAGQPISMLITGGVFQLLDMEELEILGDGFSVRVAGASYEHGKADDCRSKTKKGSTYLMSVGHFWFGQTDGEFNGEPLYSPDFLGQGEADMYAIGHKHDDQGVVVRDGKYYIVPGSISLTGEKANDSTRRPAASFVKITKVGIDVKVLRPKVPAIADLVNLEQRAQQIQEAHALEEFVVNISSAKVTGADPKQIIGEMDLTPDVLGKVEYYLDLAGKSA